MILIIKVITIIIATFFLLKSINKIKKGIVNSVYIAYLGFYMFFVLPILLDVLIAYPEFSNHQFIGFYYSINDFYSELIYCIFIIYSSCFMYVFGKDKSIHKNELKKIKIKGLKNKIILYVLSMFIFVPSVLIIIKIKSLNLNIENIFNYDFLRLIFRRDANFLFYYYLSLLSVISFIFILFLSNKNMFYLTFIYSIPIYISFGIHGKRNLIAIFIFLYIFVLMFKFNIKPRNYKYLFIILLFFVLTFSIVYQKDIRGINIRESTVEAYTNFRVDYGRDDVVKMAIFNNLKDERIMKGNGNSHLYFFKFINPHKRYFRSEYKYSVYATSVLLGYSFPRDLGWGMTTGIYDESISNYGLIFGVIISNMLVCITCRVGDKTKDGITLLFTYITVFLLQILQLTSFIFIFATWFLLIINYRYSMLKSRST